MTRLGGEEGKRGGERSAGKLCKSAQLEYEEEEEGRQRMRSDRFGLFFYS